MRASLSAPGVFAPVERNGRLLVDGGIASNLPVDVAREMGVDLLIVVDVGFPLLERKRLASAPVISNQMIAILIRRESQRQRETLDADDIIIDPPLGEASSFDFNRIPDAIEVGKRAALEAAPRLASRRAAARCVRALRAAARIGPQRRAAAHRVRARGAGLRTLRARAQEALRERDRQAGGSRTSSASASLSSTGRAISKRSTTGSSTTSRAATGLALTARRNSWGPNYVRFGLNLQDDFEGNSSYNAAARFVSREITRAGGEWVWDLQIGDSPRIATELYLPLSQGPGFFSPHAQLEARNIFELEEQRRVAELRVRSFDYGLDFGHEFGNWGEIRAGYSRVSRRLARAARHADAAHRRLRRRQLLRALDVRPAGRREFSAPRPDVHAAVGRAAVRRGCGAILRSASRSTGSPRARGASRPRCSGRRSAPRSAMKRPTCARSSVWAASSISPACSRIAHRPALRRRAPAAVSADRPRGARVSSMCPPTSACRTKSATCGTSAAMRASAPRARTRACISVSTRCSGPVYLATGFDEGGEQAFYLFLGRTF